MTAGKLRKNKCGKEEEEEITEAAKINGIASACQNPSGFRTASSLYQGKSSKKGISRHKRWKGLFPEAEVSLLPDRTHFVLNRSLSG